MENRRPYQAPQASETQVTRVVQGGTGTGGDAMGRSGSIV